MRSRPTNASFHNLLRIGSILAVCLLAIAATPAPSPSPQLPKERYLSPIEMVSSPDGGLLYVVCQGSDEVRVVEAESGKVTAIIRVGHVPRGLTITRDGHFLYVTNAWADTVSEIDTATRQVTRSLPAGFEPGGVALDHTENNLYVANRLSDDISVIDLATGLEIKRLLAGRGASYLAASPNGKLIYGTHIYPNPGAYRTPPASEITVIDTETQRVVERKPMHNVAGVFHVALAADGEFGVAAQLRPKNLIPL